MSSLDERVIDNPLNPTTGDGRVKNRTRGAKGVLLLFVVLGAMAIAVPYVYGYIQSVINSWAISVAVIVIVYTPIALKMISVTVLDEKTNKLAFIDQIENEVSTLSTTWEIQDIKQMEINGEKVGYIDYINGIRVMAVKIVMGSTLNVEDSKLSNHFNVMTEFYDTIDSFGFTKDVRYDEESSDEDEALQFYYQAANDSGDEQYIKTFTRMLDYVQYVVKTYGSITSTIVIIKGWGPTKHLMAERVPSLLPILGGSDIVYEYFLMTGEEINEYISHDNAVSSFNIDDIKMKKYRNTSKLGETAVIEVRDREGNVTAQYNPRYDTKRKTSIKSIGTQRGEASRELTPAEKLRIIEEKRKKQEIKSNTNSYKEEEGESFTLGVNDETDLFIRLVEDSNDEEVVLGGKKK